MELTELLSDLVDLPCKFASRGKNDGQGAYASINPSLFTQRQQALQDWKEIRQGLSGASLRVDENISGFITRKKRRETCSLDARGPVADVHSRSTKVGDEERIEAETLEGGCVGRCIGWLVGL